MGRWRLGNCRESALSGPERGSSQPEVLSRLLEQLAGVTPHGGLRRPGGDQCASHFGCRCCGSHVPLQGGRPVGLASPTGKAVNVLFVKFGIGERKIQKKVRIPQLSDVFFPTGKPLAGSGGTRIMGIAHVTTRSNPDTYSRRQGAQPPGCESLHTPRPACGHDRGIRLRKELPGL